MRLGGRTTAISILLITLTGFIYPFVVPGDQVGKPAESVNAAIFGFQSYILFVFYNGLMTALAVDQGARIKRQMETRNAIARAARLRAIKASQAKTEFLAAMSHKLRTPLNGVMGFTQILLQRKSLPSDMRRKLELIEKSGEALLVIVNDVLDYSRIESGRVVLKPSPIQISSLTDDAIEMTSGPAKTKGLKLSKTFEGETFRTWNLDEARVRQVLLNLLDNAVKFTDVGTVDLKVTINQAFARFEVTDTGVGIPQDRQDMLFEGFTQLDASLTRAHGGADLGLAICKSLVGLMGGRIGVESRPGHGTTFWFEIPLEAAEDQSAPQHANGERVAHILVADDHPVNRGLAVTILGLLGCTCDFVENGAEAVEAMKVGNYDAVLMDVHMPVMDGVAATRAIRAMSEKVGRVPIIGLSADVMPESLERCMSAGMDDHLGKPVNVVKLQTSLMRCFANVQHGAENAD